MLRPHGNIWRRGNTQNANLLVVLMIFAHVLLRSSLQPVSKAWLFSNSFELVPFLYQAVVCHVCHNQGVAAWCKGIQLLGCALLCVGDIDCQLCSAAVTCIQSKHLLLAMQHKVRRGTPFRTSFQALPFSTSSPMESLFLAMLPLCSLALPCPPALRPCVPP